MRETTRRSSGFRLGMLSGLLGTSGGVVGIGSDTLGHLACFRWGSSAKTARVYRVSASWRTIAGFSATQEVGIDLFKVTGYASSHTGGTAGTPVARMGTTSVLTSARMAGVTQLTAVGPPTFGTGTIASAGYSEPAAAAVIARGNFMLEADFSEIFGEPLLLGANEGLVLRSLTAFGAGGSARVSFIVDWDEV